MGSLFYKFPILLPVLETHLKDNSGEILSHLLMGDIERWIENRERLEKNNQITMEILEYLEKEYGREEYVDNLIAVSFLEMLPSPGKEGASIRYRLGPKLTEQLKVIWPSDKALD